MKHFDSIEVKQPQKNVFDLSNENKLSCKMAQLVPIYVEEVIPGDIFKVKTELMLRMSPLLAPVMHRVNVFTHYFFVPNRLVWSNWENFITGGPDGTYAGVPPAIIFADATKANFAKGTLADYLGIPSAPGAVTTAINMNAMVFRAYQHIYNEYYRDQNLQTKLVIANGDAGDDAVSYTLRTRCWEKDYLTSALPWAQRGAVVNLPITNTVTYKPPEVTAATAITAGQDVEAAQATNPSTLRFEAANPILEFDNINSISSILTLNELRRVTKLQEWLERNARGGARYVEQILSHFGVKVPDYRLQRPEYLGGGKSPIVISEVLQTAEGTGNVGRMAGHGISIGQSHGFKKEFLEHGYVIGIMSVLPRTAYNQGVPRHFSKTSKYDYFFPEFANLGEQEVYAKEAYCAYNDAAQNTEIFGYQERYAEYKYKNSEVHGDFKDTLSFWHMGRIFAAKPALNSAFVTSDPTTRIYAVPTGDTLWVQIYNDVQAVRPMPYYGTPSF